MERSRQPDSADSYATRLILLDDFTHIAGLSDLYAETASESLTDLKRLKASVARHCMNGLNGEGRLNHDALVNTYHAAPAGIQARLGEDMGAALNAALRATRPYSLPHPDKGITERSIDGQRQHLIRHQAATNANWLDCMLTASDNSRLDRLEYWRGASPESTPAMAKEYALMGICAAWLDALDPVASQHSRGWLQTAQARYAALNERAPHHGIADQPAGLKRLSQGLLAQLSPSTGGAPPASTDSLHEALSDAYHQHERHNAATLMLMGHAHREGKAPGASDTPYHRGAANNAPLLT